MATPNACEDMENWITPEFLVRIKMIHWKRVWKYLRKLNMYSSYSPEIALMCIYHKEIKTMFVQKPVQ